MKLYRVTSTNSTEIYVFARGNQDAAAIYVSFKQLLDCTQDVFAVERIDRQPGWIQNRTLKRLLKTGARGVSRPYPKNYERLSEVTQWMIWAPPDDS